MLFRYAARRTFCPPLAAVLVLAALATTAQGAVLECGPSVAGEGRVGPSEVEAKRAALDAWLAKVGPGAVWRLATNKGITCSALANGTFVCKATGHPCVLHQAPPHKNLKRLMPAAPGNPT